MHAHRAQVPARVRERRRDELISLQQRVGEEWAARLVGQEVEVLVDGYNDDGFLIGGCARAGFAF